MTDFSYLSNYYRLVVVKELHMFFIIVVAFLKQFQIYVASKVNFFNFNKYVFSILENSSELKCNACCKRNVVNHILYVYTFIKNAYISTHECTKVYA